MSRQLRVAIAGAGHWHCPMYLKGIKDADVQIVGVSDHDEETAARYGAEFGCENSSHLPSLIEKTSPDFVFAFGRHIEMPQTLEALINAEIPFCVEKPAGIHYQDVLDLAEQAERKGLFAAAPFVMRKAGWITRIKALHESGMLGNLAHLYFRYHAGPVNRYQTCNCDWMLDPNLSGGGCSINLGIHYVDLFMYLTGEEAEVRGAVAGNRVCGEQVEDTSTILLQSTQGVTGVVESGYNFPSASGSSCFSIISSELYCNIDRSMHLVWKNGDEEEAQLTFYSYADFAKDLLDDFREGTQPVAALRDVGRALKIINEAQSI